jgi:hypothetical protein
VAPVAASEVVWVIGRLEMPVVVLLACLVIARLEAAAFLAVAVCQSVAAYQNGLYDVIDWMA